MEIKILCPCGTKFKFDVEPVNHRMPAPALCPACGADATAQANAIIQSNPAPAPAVPATPPSPAPPTGLRVTRVAAPAAEPAAVAAVAHAPAPVPARPAPIRPGPSGRPAQGKNQWVKVASAILTVALVLFGVWRFGSKWARRLTVIAEVASAAGDASLNDAPVEGAKNLLYEDAAVLFIKHTNHLEIAQACQDYWKTNLHKDLSVVNNQSDYENPGEYELVPPHNGFIRLITQHDWPVAQQEGVAQTLSQQFGTLVFEWRSEHVADTFHFGVYDQGARKFHAQMDIKMTKDGEDEVVTTEGNDYARANGFKPGPDGFKKFDELDADKITRKLGMKLWDEPEGTAIKGMTLKETGP